MLEAADTVGGAAVTDEFLPGFRNSAASYTVSLLNPKVIRDMELERHGLKVVLRKMRQFPSRRRRISACGRNGLTRKEIVRLNKADGEGYDRYIAELENGRSAHPEMAAAALRPKSGRRAHGPAVACSRSASDLLGLSTDDIRIVHDFATRSAGDILDRYFEGDLAKALFGFDGVVGNFASPYAPGTRLRPAPPSVRRSGGRARRLGPCHRRHGLDHAGDGPCGARERRRHPARHAGRGNYRRQRQRGRRGRRRQGVAREHRHRRASIPKLLFDRLVPQGAVDADGRQQHGTLEVRKRDLPDERRACRSCPSSPCSRRRAIT